MIAVLFFAVIAEGGWFIVAAVADWDRFKGVSDTSEVEMLIGDTATRWLVGIVGFVLVAGGIYRLN